MIWNRFKVPFFVLIRLTRAPTIAAIEEDGHRNQVLSVQVNLCHRICVLWTVRQSPFQNQRLSAIHATVVQESNFAHVWHNAACGWNQKGGSTLILVRAKGPCRELTANLDPSQIRRKGVEYFETITPDF